MAATSRYSLIDQIEITERLRHLPFTEDRLISTNRYPEPLPNLPRSYETHPEAFQNTSPEYAEFLQDRAEEIANSLVAHGRLPAEIQRFWDLNGYDPARSTANAKLTDRRIRRIEAYLGLIPTGNLDELTANFKRKYYTAGCLNFHDLQFCWRSGVIQNDVAMVEQIFRSNLFPTEDQLADGLKDAIRLGYPRMVTLLLYFPGSTVSAAEIKLAIRSGYLQITRLLLDQYSGTNHRKFLRLAIRSGYVELVKILFSNRFQPKIASYLRIAAKNGNLEVFDFLIHQLPPEDSITGNYLGVASANGRKEFLEYLFQLSPTSHLRYPIEAAIRADNVSGLSFLSTKSTETETMYRLAVKYGSIECLRFLFQSVPLPINMEELAKEFLDSTLNSHPEATIDILVSQPELTPHDRVQIFKFAFHANQLYLTAKILNDRVGPMLSEGGLYHVRTPEMVEILAPYVSEDKRDAIFIQQSNPVLIPVVSSAAINQKLSTTSDQDLIIDLLPRATSNPAIDTAFIRCFQQGHFIPELLDQFLWHLPSSLHLSETVIDQTLAEIWNQPFRSKDQTKIAIQLVPRATAESLLREMFFQMAGRWTTRLDDIQLLSELAARVSVHDIETILPTVRGEYNLQVLLPYVQSLEILETVFPKFVEQTTSIDPTVWNLFLNRISSHLINIALETTTNWVAMEMLIPSVTDTGIISAAFLRFLNQSLRLETLDAFLSRVSDEDINEGLIRFLDRIGTIERLKTSSAQVSDDEEYINGRFIRSKNNAILVRLIPRVTAPAVITAAFRQFSGLIIDQNNAEAYRLFLDRVSSDEIAVGFQHAQTDDALILLFRKLESIPRTDQISAALGTAFINFVRRQPNSPRIPKYLFNRLFGCPRYLHPDSLINDQTQICESPLPEEVINQAYTVTSNPEILKLLLPYTTSAESRGIGLVAVSAGSGNTDLIGDILKMGVPSEAIWAALGNKLSKRHLAEVTPFIEFGSTIFLYQYLRTPGADPRIVLEILNRISDPLAISIFKYSNPQLFATMAGWNPVIRNRLDTIYSEGLTRVLVGLQISDLALIQSVTAPGLIVDEMVDRKLFSEITSLIHILGQPSSPNEEALIWAAQIGSRKLVQYLLGLDTRPDYKSWAAMQYAQAYNFTGIHDDLYQAGKRMGLISSDS